MAIIRSNNDNKVIRDVSGAVLIENNTLIDVDSDFIKKDGSNQVIYAKILSTPRTFIGVNNPIENGDGFEFNGNNGLKGAPIDITKNITIELWVKVDSILSNLVIAAQRDGNTSGAHMQLYTVAGELNYDVSYLSSFNNLSGIVRYNFSVDTYAHILINQNVDSGIISLYVNGKPTQGFKDIVFKPLDENLPHGIGARIGGSAGLQGHIRKYKIHPFTNPNLDNYDGVGNDAKWDETIQVFTSPNYPNLYY